MISSTVIDLKSHRSEVLTACLRQNVYPIMMEHSMLNDDTTPLAQSLELVEQCDIYVLVLGFKYGHVIPSFNKSITELEYEHAIFRKKNVCSL